MLKDFLVKISNFGKCRFIRFTTLIAITVLFVFFPCLVFSETPDDTEKQAPLHVISDQMIAVRDTSMVEFIGNVKATRLDGVLLADSVKVFFNEASGKENDTPQSNIKKVVATGNVRGTSGDRKAFADKAVYTAEDDVLVLTGKSPKLVTGSSFVTGKKITWFRLQDKVTVESDGTNRVEALFNPEDNVDKKQ